VHSTSHMLSWTHPSSQPKWHPNRFSHFCTVHDRMSSGMPGHDLSPEKCTLAWCNQEPHLARGSFCPTRILSPNGMTIGSAVFVYRSPQCVRILYNRSPLLPLRFPFPWGRGPPSNTWYFGPTRVFKPNRQTDRQNTTRSVTVGRIYVRSTAIRPHNNHNLS